MSLPVAAPPMASVRSPTSAGLRASSRQPTPAGVLVIARVLLAACRPRGTTSGQTLCKTVVGHVSSLAVALVSVTVAFRAHQQLNQVKPILAA